MFLSKFATKVHVIVRRDELRASKIMADRAQANRNSSSSGTAWSLDLPVIPTLARGDAQERQDRRGNRVACPRVVRRHRPRARTPTCSQAFLITRTTATSRRSAFRRTRTSRASSPAAMCRTTCTARRSRPPAPGCMAAIDCERWLERPVSSGMPEGVRSITSPSTITPRPPSRRPHVVRQPAHPHRRQLRRDVGRRRYPGAGRFLGRVVWAVQDDCTRPRADRTKSARVQLTIGKLNIDDNLALRPASM